MMFFFILFFSFGFQSLCLSYYAIQDLDTEEYVVNFSEEHTKVSCDPSGNFFTLYTAGFQPERYYRLLLKVPNSDGITHELYDNNWIFKVTRS